MSNEKDLEKEEKLSNNNDEGIENSPNSKTYEIDSPKDNISEDSVMAKSESSNNSTTNLNVNTY